jgi:hypothetical protein
VSKQFPQVQWRELEKLERRIAASDGGGVLERWHYGQEILKAKAGKKRIPDGMLEDLVKAAGTKPTKRGERKSAISVREIRNRVRLAEVYPTEAHVRQIFAELGLWSEIIAQGFPEVIVDEAMFDVDETPAAPDAWEQLTLLPGFRAVVRVGGKDTPIADMTVPEAIAYREKSRATHESYGKWLAQIDLTVDIVIDGWDGDPEAKALDAYKRGIST